MSRQRSNKETRRNVSQIRSAARLCNCPLIGKDHDVFDPYVGHWVAATFRLLATKRQQCPDRRTEESANQAIERPEKQVVSGHGRVLPNDFGSVARVVYSIGKSSGTLPNLRSTVVLDTG